MCIRDRVYTSPLIYIIVLNYVPRACRTFSYFLPQCASGTHHLFINTPRQHRGVLLSLLRVFQLKKIPNNHGMSGPQTAWPVTSSSIVFSRVPPVCQHRPVLYRLGIATHAISQTRSTDEGTFFEQAYENMPGYEPTRLILS